jgi:hypothetical protein
MSTTLPFTPTRQDLVQELIDLFLSLSIEVKGARGIGGYPPTQPIANDGYGSAGPKRPDVVGFDPELRRIVFGLVRMDRQSLDSEASLEEYNVFLDHNAGLNEQASVVYVLMPQDLVNEFTGIVTHYVHRDYWHRIIGAGSRRG